MDGILPADMRVRLLRATNALPDILNAVETEVSWPSAQLHAKKAFVDKANVSSFAADLLHIRILTITQVVYRLYARVCFSDVNPRVEE